MEGHDVAHTARRAGQRPEEIIEANMDK